ncbi:MAG: hypothetical protein AAF747_07410, partial [Planctomycetota bacterium]
IAVGDAGLQITTISGAAAPIAVMLQDDVSVSASGSGAVLLPVDSAIDGPFALAIDSGGVTRLGSIGSSAPLGSVTVSGPRLELHGSVHTAGDFSATGGNTGDIDFVGVPEIDAFGALAAANELALLTDATGGGVPAGSVLLASDVDFAASDLASLLIDVRADDNASFGAVTIPDAFFQDFTQVTILAGPTTFTRDIQIDGGFTFAGDFILGSDVTIDTNSTQVGSSPSIDLSAARVSADAPGFTLTLDTSSADVGGGVLLGLVSDIGGGSLVDGVVVDTAGGVANGVATLGGDITTDLTFVVDGVLDVVGDRAITLQAMAGEGGEASPTIDLAGAKIISTSGDGALLLDVTTPVPGVVRLGDAGDVKSDGNLREIDIDLAGQLRLSGDVRVDRFLVDGVLGEVLVSGPVAVTTADSGVDFGNATSIDALDGASADSLDISASVATEINPDAVSQIVLPERVGVATRLGSLTLTADDIRIGTVLTAPGSDNDGSQGYAGPVTISGQSSLATVSSNGGAISFDESLSLAFDTAVSSLTDVRVDAGTGVATFGGIVDASTGDLLIVADDVAIADQFVSDGGTLSFATSTVGLPMFFARSPGVEGAAFVLDQTESLLIERDFSLVTIGDAVTNSPIFVGQDRPVASLLPGYNLVLDAGSATITVLDGLALDNADAVFLSHTVIENNLDMALGTGTARFGSTVDVNGAILRVLADGIDFDAIVSGGGEVTLAPSAADGSIGVGDGALVEGTLTLDAGDLAQFTEEFTQIFIGVDGGSHNIAVGSFDIASPITFRSGVSPTFLTGAMATTGDAVTFAGPTRVIGVASIDTASGEANALGAPITFSAGLDGALASADALTLATGQGAIGFLGEVGAAAGDASALAAESLGDAGLLESLQIVSAGDTTFERGATVGEFVQLAGGVFESRGSFVSTQPGGIDIAAGDIAFREAVTTQLSGPISLTSAGAVNVDGDLDADGPLLVAVDVDANESLTSTFGGLIEADSLAITGNENDGVVFAMDVTLTEGDSVIALPSAEAFGSFDAEGDLIFATGPNGTVDVFGEQTLNSAGDLTFDGRVAFDGPSLTLITSELELLGGDDSVSGLGTVFVRTPGAGDAIGLGGTVGTSADDPTRFDLLERDLDAFAGSIERLVVGTAGGSHAVTSVGFSVDYPMTVLSPNGTFAFESEHLLAGQAFVIDAPAQLIGNASLVTSDSVPSGGDITLTQTLDGTFNLLIDTGLAGDFTTSDSIGALSRLGDITVTQSDQFNVDADLFAESFTQSAGNATTFDGVADLSGISPDGFGFRITADTVNINGGLTSAGGPIEIDAATNLRSDIATQSQAVTLTGPTTIFGDRFIDMASSGGPGADLTVNGPLDVDSSMAAGNFAINAGSNGNIIFNGDVGAMTPLGDVVVSDAELLELNGEFSVASLTRQDGTGETLINAPLITSGIDGVVLNSTVNTINGAITASAGPITLNGETNLGADLSTLGMPIDFDGDTVVTEDVSLTTGGGRVAFNSTLDADGVAPRGLTINPDSGEVSVAGVVGGVSPLESFTQTSGSAVFGSASTFAGDVDLAGNAFTFGDDINIGGNLSIVGMTTITGDVTAGGAVQIVGDTTLTQLTTVISNGTNFDGNLIVNGAFTADSGSGPFNVSGATSVPTAFTITDTAAFSAGPINAAVVDINGVDVLINLTGGNGGTFLPDPNDEGRALPESDIQSVEERLRAIELCRPDIASLDVTTASQVDGDQELIYLNTTRTLRAMASAYQELG